METIILILLSFTFVFSLAINLMQRDIIKDLRNELNIKNNSFKLWLDEEVDMKRTYKKLSDSLLEDRDYYRNELNKSIKKYNKLYNLTNRFIKNKLSIDNLNIKFKKFIK
jgi:hypothetical protein